MASGSALYAHPAGGPSTDDPALPVVLADSQIRIAFDGRMRWKVWYAGATAPPVLISGWCAPDALTLSGPRVLELFTLTEHSRRQIDGVHGRGTQLRLTGMSGQLEKELQVELYERYAGLAVLRITYRNRSQAALPVLGWRQAALRLPAGGKATAQEPAFFSYCGSTHADRRDWVQPLSAHFTQENDMGMSASDYGGGTPIVDVWRREAGVAIGHLSLTPEAVAIPLARSADGVSLAMSASCEHTLAPGATLATPEAFIAAHRGDHFATLTHYRNLMADRGVQSPSAPDAAYEPIWCAWGYERDCTLELIRDTLPKVRELGLGWAVIDDGWQSNVGDWKLNAAKYPRGETDMTELVAAIREQKLRPRLWFAPLAAAPGSDLLHDHTDMLLLDRDGAPQNVSWWNSFYLCPAYAPTVAYTQALVRQFIGKWGFAGLKIDGQHLNGVAPCYNPAHRHARPSDSVSGLQDFLYGLYQTAMAINPQAVVELCPCGTAYSFFNFRAFNQAPASDPESSWQVRHKGKTLKALMGRGATFAGDHVELSDHGSDFASTVGIGAVVSTKFTWPRDPKPKDSFLLTPEKEALWRRWISCYNERQLPRGTYRGELYDIGFDKPETHAIEKDGHFYYAFYARQFNGPVTLRGLDPRGYRVRDYFAGRELGELAPGSNRLRVAFEQFMLVEAIPL